MAPPKLVVALLLVVGISCLIIPTSSREVPFEPSNLPLEHMFMAAGGGAVTGCWNALLDLRSCTNEIVLFFLNGESYLGQGCCRAIRVITSQCWPSMLTSIGFTAEEGDVLRGYCDASSAPTDAPPPYSSSPPAAAPVPLVA